MKSALPSTESRKMASAPSRAPPERKAAKPFIQVRVLLGLALVLPFGICTASRTLPGGS